MVAGATRNGQGAGELVRFVDADGRGVAARAAKRAADVVGAALAIVLLAPLWLLTALLIKLDSRGRSSSISDESGETARSSRCASSAR